MREREFDLRRRESVQIRFVYINLARVRRRGWAPRFFRKFNG